MNKDDYVTFYYNFLIMLILRVGMHNNINFTSGLKINVTVVFSNRDFP